MILLARRRPILYRNQPICLQSKSMDWFLYDKDLRLESINNRISTVHQEWILTGEYLENNRDPLDKLSNRL